MKFSWQKMGMIFDTSMHVLPSWAENSVLQPTPILMNDGEVIRLFAGMRDSLGQSRVGYIDVSSDNPKEILGVSTEPVLDLGDDGCFDDSGVVPLSIIKDNGVYYMYYAGYSLLKKVRFCVFGGLAESIDGHQFEKYSIVPVFERTHEHCLFRAPHSILKENGIYKIWFGAGSKFFEMGGYTYPMYDIHYCETHDLSVIPKESINVLTFNSEDEYRVARPFVVKIDNVYCMFLCVATKSEGYRLAYAESYDGKVWHRCDDNLSIEKSYDGWDSQMMGYPSFIETKYGSYLFYNGNDYGKFGFGYARLISVI